MNTISIVFLTIYLTASFIYSFIDPHMHMQDGKESSDSFSAYDEDRYKFTPWEFLRTWIVSSFMMVPWMLGLLSIAKTAAYGRHYKYMKNQSETFARYINLYLFSDLSRGRTDEPGTVNQRLSEDEVNEIIDKIEEQMVENHISFTNSTSDRLPPRPEGYENKYTFDERLRFFKRVRTNS